MSSTRKILITGLVVVGLLGIGAFAFAQTGRGPIAWALSGGPPWADGDDWGGWRGHGPWGGRGPWGGPPWHRGPDPEELREVRSELAEDLAAELDTSAERVESAFRNVVSKRLHEAVEAGLIDREDANEALQAYEDGDMRVLFRVLKERSEESRDERAD